ncbi:MAG TPA: MFS transporter [Micromonosporaceae bacterium]|nr:MFS transporter [Micromonosporaceae bacterium]
MTAVAPRPAATADGGGRPYPYRLVAVLAVTQTVGYGVLTYAFPVLLVPMAAELHTTRAAITAAATVSIVVSAVAAIPVGRWLDRRGGRALMTAGSALGVAAVIAWSAVRTPVQLYVVFAAIGVAMAATLYEAAFPVVVATTEAHQRHRALLMVTIVAGFASSIFFPLTGVLLAHGGWRWTVRWLVVILAVITVPAHALAIPDRASHLTPPPGSGGSDVRGALADRRFWLTGVAFVAQAGAVSAVSVLLVSYLRQAGHAATTAAVLSGLLGVLSVTGRLTVTGLARRHGMAAVTAAVFVVQAAGVALLPYAGRSLGGAAACITAFGLGFGVATIARPAILADRYGTVRYATIAATMATPVSLAKAFGPLAAASVPSTVFLDGAGAACLLAASLVWITGRP